MAYDISVARRADCNALSAVTGARRLGISDHGAVYLACKVVSAQWRDLETRLGVIKPTLDIIQANNRGDVEGCMSEVIAKWLKKDVLDQGADPPTWRNLCLALSHIDKPLAESISVEHGCGYLSLLVSEVSYQSGASSVFLPQCCGCGLCHIKGWMTTKCSQRVLQPVQSQQCLIIDAKKFVNFPATSQIQCLEAMEIAEHFYAVTMETWACLKESLDQQKCSLSDVTLKLNDFLKYPLPLISSISELQMYFHTLRVTWSNYRPLYFICQQFLSTYSDLVSCWNNYCKIMNAYASRRSLKLFVNTFFQIEDQNIMIVEIDDSSYDFMLSNVEDLSFSLSSAVDIPPSALHLVTVKGGRYLSIYFQYCYSDYLTKFMSLTVKQLQLLCNINELGYRILSLTDIHNQFRYNKIQQRAYKDEAAGGEVITASILKSNEPQVVLKKNDLLMRSLKETNDYCASLKEVLSGKDSELSEKATDLKNKEEEILHLKKKLFIVETKLSDLKLEVIRVRKSKDEEMFNKDYKILELNQVKDKLSEAKTDLHKALVRKEEVLQMWKTLAVTKSEKDQFFMIKEAIIKETSGGPMKSISLHCGHYSVVVCDNGDILTTEQDSHKITVLDKKGRRLRSMGQSLASPDGLAITNDGHVLVADQHRLWKLTMDGVCVKSVGSTKKGTEPLEFNDPCGITVHPTTGQIFIAEEANDRVQVLNADLTFSHIVTVPDGHKPFNAPYDVALDSEGYLYVADQCNNCVTKLTIAGHYMGRIGCKGCGHGQLKRPVSVSVNNNLVYVSEWGNHRVSVFDTHGRFIHCIGEDEGIHPWGVAIDRQGILYIIDTDNQRILLY